MSTNEWRITDFGAVPGEERDQAPCMQNAVDQCAMAGGGRVHVPPGTFYSGTVVLKSGVTIVLDGGAEWRALGDLKAFPEREPSRPGNYNFFMRHALLFADGARNIGLEGPGTIHGAGDHPAFQRTTHEAPGRYQNRPSVIRLVNCEQVRVDGVSIRDSAFWTFHLMACRDVVIHGIHLHSRSPNYNSDGLDIDSCEQVRVSDCLIDSEDDAISIKGTTALPCRQVQVTNCLLSSHCNAIRIGAENFRAFEDIHVSNCHIYDSRNGVTFQNIDGYPMRRLSFVNLSMHRVGVPVHMVTHRKTYPVGVPEEEYPIPHGPGPCSIEDVVFDGLHGRDIGCYEGLGPVNERVQWSCRSPCVFSGHRDAPIRRLVLRNVDLAFPGGGTEEDRNRVIMDVNEHPNPGGEPTGVYGLYLRHVSDALLDGVRLHVETPDARPAVLAEGVRGMELRHAVLDACDHGAIVRLHDAQDVNLHGCRAVDAHGHRRSMEPDDGSVEYVNHPFSQERVEPV